MDIRKNKRVIIIIFEKIITYVAVYLVLFRESDIRDSLILGVIDYNTPIIIKCLNSEKTK